jgi:hypothetical protein
MGKKSQKKRKRARRIKIGQLEGSIGSDARSSDASSMTNENKCSMTGNLGAELITPASITGRLGSLDLCNLDLGLATTRAPDAAGVIWATNIMPIHNSQLFNIHVERPNVRVKRGESRGFNHPNSTGGAGGGCSWLAMVSNGRGNTSTTKVADTKRRPRNQQYEASTSRPSAGRLHRSNDPAVLAKSTFSCASRRAHVREEQQYSVDGAGRPGGGYPSNAILGLILFDGDYTAEAMRDNELSKHMRPGYTHNWCARAVIEFGSPIMGVRYRVPGSGLVGRCEPLFLGFVCDNGCCLRSEIQRRLPGRGPVSSSGCWCLSCSR